MTVGTNAIHKVGMTATFDIAAIAQLANSYGAHRNWSLNTTSLRASGKGTYFSDLVAGRVGLTLRRRDKIIQWFSDNWPDADLAWPQDIYRPEKSREAA